MQEAKIPIISNEQCGERNKDQSGNSRITQNMVCAGFETDSKVSGCHGDSGGPLVCKSKENRWVSYFTKTKKVYRYLLNILKP